MSLHGYIHAYKGLYDLYTLGEWASGSVNNKTRTHLFHTSREYSSSPVPVLGSGCPVPVLGSGCFYKDVFNYKKDGLI